MLHITNFAKSVKNLCTGKHFASLDQYYDARYPPTKFLRADSGSLNIRCILCGFPRSGTNWVIHVVESSTGMQIGNIGARKPDARDGTVALLKIHARSKTVARAKALWLLPRHHFEWALHLYVPRSKRRYYFAV